MTWVILGCGYTGSRLAARLVASGEHVIATVRDPGRARLLGSTLGVEAMACEIHQAGALDWLPGGCVVVDSIPATLEEPPHAPIVSKALTAAGGGRLIYLSSTGVYGPAAGGWVDEDTPPNPTGAHGMRRLAEENTYAQLANSVSLRVAAIYGPARGVHARLARGSYSVPGDGLGYTSRIHVDDLVSVIIAAGRVLRLERKVYVVADDAPTTTREHADACARLLGLPVPESTPLDNLSPLARELATGDRRVRNARMKHDLGIRLRHPTWQTGVPASLAAREP